MKKENMEEQNTSQNIKDTTDRMIRVNHAVEFGASRIYEGQLSVLAKSTVGQTIQDMADQEKDHLETFDKLIIERRIRPTALSPIWSLAGYTLGVVTARMGEKAAMACTVAVEEVIEEHYKTQYETLGENDPELSKIIDKFRLDEIEHKSISNNFINLNNSSESEQDENIYPLMSKAIKAGSKLAIWLSTRL